MYKVIFVDDEPWAVVDMIHSIPWNDAGFFVSGYYDSPTQAFEKIIEQKPDLVFTERLIATSAGYQIEGDAAYFISVEASTMGLTVRAYDAVIVTEGVVALIIFSDFFSVYFVYCYVACLFEIKPQNSARHISFSSGNGFVERFFAEETP